MKNTGFVSRMLAVVLFASGAAGCRRPDTDIAQDLAQRPAEFENINVHGACVARAANFVSSPQLQASLCSNATSTEPVDCFKKAKKENLDDAAAVEKCKAKR